jgi:hypothetical protein
MQALRAFVGRNKRRPAQTGEIVKSQAIVTPSRGEVPDVTIALRLDDFAFLCCLRCEAAGSLFPAKRERSLTSVAEL